MVLECPRYAEVRAEMINGVNVAFEQFEINEHKEGD